MVFNSFSLEFYIEKKIHSTFLIVHIALEHITNFQKTNCILKHAEQSNHKIAGKHNNNLRQKMEKNIK